MICQTLPPRCFNKQTIVNNVEVGKNILVAEEF